MPRFSVAFRRKPSLSADESLNVAPEQPSFRVIERGEGFSGKSFDGGAKMARSSPGHAHTLSQTGSDMEDNMFANLSDNRGSGTSNITHPTSTDTSSRHSNTSTAPSSADPASLANHETARTDPKRSKNSFVDDKPKSSPKPSGSSFLDRAGRTFSFGGQKKPSTPSTAHDPMPNVQTPSKGIAEEGRSRGWTESTVTTATPPKMEDEGLDLGGDFGSMFSRFDKRASINMLANGQSKPPAMAAPVNANPQSYASSFSGKPSFDADSTSEFDRVSSLTSSIYTSQQRPPPVPPHHAFDARSPSLPSDIMENEDTSLLQDSIAAGKFLSSDSTNASPSGRFRRDDGVAATRSISTSQDENMFHDSPSRFARSASKPTQRLPSRPQTKVMTPAQFEKYRQDKERLDGAGPSSTPAAKAADEDEDDINYDDDEDEREKSKQQVKQRRKQEAHMAVYRQQMMKVTGEPSAPSPTSSNRPNLPVSMSAPLLSAPHTGHKKTPSHVEITAPVSDDDDDDEVPLAILQAHGFPHKNRPPTRLQSASSYTNLRESASLRPRSTMGDVSSNSTQRHSALPAFARHLPQDPFVGASIAQPALRESMSFSGGSQALHGSGGLPPGGLVGVIANEERSRAMRRGSPNYEAQKIGGAAPAQVPGIDPISGIPHHMMYGTPGHGGMASGTHTPHGFMTPPMMHMPTMPGMPQQSLSPGDQAQMQMTQQMQQFMQMQMQFMQMMAANQNGGSPMPSQPPFMESPQQSAPYPGLGTSQSTFNLSSRQSVMGDAAMGPRRMSLGMRTMSMVQPSSASLFQQGGYAPSMAGPPAGYAASIAPSERSNIGLPGRYRPVSQAPPQGVDVQQRSNTMSGALSQWDEPKGRSTFNVIAKSDEPSDEDDDDGWAAMKAKREKKKLNWRSKKTVDAA